MRNANRSLGLALFLSLSLYPLASLAGQYFVYKSQDGTAWYSDRHLPADRFELIDTVGRPTASRSCQGVTQTIMARRARAHGPVIGRYARHYGVDEPLIKAIISAESCFDAYAVSRVGAQGLMQLMPATAKHMGVYNAFDAEDNLRGGIRYFALMMKRFANDRELALAAYNAGPSAVAKYGGIPPYAETQKYVKRVLAYYERYARLASGQ